MLQMRKRLRLTPFHVESHAVNLMNCLYLPLILSYGCPAVWLAHCLQCPPQSQSDLLALSFHTAVVANCIKAPGPPCHTSPLPTDIVWQTSPLEVSILWSNG